MSEVTALDIKVARVLDDYTVVLNKGGEHGIGSGQRFLIYALGDDVADPDTGESLGALEVVKGTGRATHVQEKICTVASDMVARAGRTIRKKATPSGRSPLAAISQLYSTETEETLPAEKVPFEAVQVGDLVKMI